MGFSPHSRMQATFTAMAQYAFPQNQKIQNFNFSEKTMASVFWDRKGILLIDFMPPGSTINAAAYCATTTRLRRVIQNKRRGMLSRGVCLPHDNARPHFADVTTVLLEKFKWDILGHPPYSLDIAPNDFTCFFTQRNISLRKSSTTMMRCKSSHDVVQRTGGSLL